MRDLLWTTIGSARATVRPSPAKAGGQVRVPRRLQLGPCRYSGMAFGGRGACSANSPPHPPPSRGKDNSLRLSTPQDKRRIELENSSTGAHFRLFASEKPRQCLTLTILPNEDRRVSPVTAGIIAHPFFRGAC